MKIIKYLAIIPARSGSKRLRKKNLRKIKTSTLLDLSIKSTIKCPEIKTVILSTDIKKFFKYKNKKVFLVKRPRQLARDNCSTESAILHAVHLFKKENRVNIKNIILLQPTSPLRNSQDIRKAIKTFETKKCDSLLSVYKQKLCLWRKKNNFYLAKNYKINKYKTIGGQFQTEEIIENGAIYIFDFKLFFKFKIRLFKNIGISFMSKKNSIEIDTIEDLKLARALS
ncbi:hypothetical protein OAP04_04255 [Pelagibacteraceae bacterium]|nr:hypothetical protein [Pelagibacteraceae bacterium]